MCYLLFILSHKIFTYVRTIAEIFEHPYDFKDMKNTQSKPFFIFRKCLNTIVINCRIRIKNNTALCEYPCFLVVNCYHIIKVQRAVGKRHFFKLKSHILFHNSREPCVLYIVFDHFLLNIIFQTGYGSCL